MKVKLDENFGRRGQEILASGGCDVETVQGENLSSSPDEDLVEVCKMEGRVLISLDKDFSNVLRFPPHEHAGIVVLRLEEPITLEQIHRYLERFLEAASGENLAGRLWVVDQRRIREYGHG